MKEVFEWFKDSGQAAFVTALLSLTAVVISVIAFLKVHRTRKRLLQIEEARERDRVRQKGKAQLVAGLVLKDSTYRLQTENRGSAEARDVVLSIDGQPVMKHPAIWSDSVRHLNTEICNVGPESSFRYAMALDQLNQQPPFEVDITWSDDSGEPGHYHTTITF